MPENETGMVVADDEAKALAAAKALAEEKKRVDRAALRAYIASLTSPKSQKTMIERLAFLAKIIGKDENATIDQIQWTSISVPQAQELRAELARLCSEKPPKLKPSTMNLSLCALRGVLAKACDFDPAPPWMTFERLQKLRNSLKSSKAKRLPVGRDLSDDEILRLLKWARTLKDERYRAMVLGLLSALLGAGLRREEVCTLDSNALREDVIRVIGKGSKEREVPLSPRALTDLRNWLEMRETLSLKTTTMFVRIEKGDVVRDRPFSPDGLYNLVRSWNAMIWEDVPVEKRNTIATHDFRRTFATRRLASGIDLLVVQRLMGHESLETTRGYDKRGLDESRRAIAGSGVY